MKKLLLILLLAAFAGGTAMPIFNSFLGFGPGTAYALDDDPGDDNQGDDDPGDDEQ